MDEQVQRDVRSAITMAYGLMQHTRTQHCDRMAQALHALEDRLREVETGLGGPRRALLGPIDFSPEILRIREVIREAEAPLGEQMAALIRSVRKLERRISRLSSRQIPARPLFGVLPLARVIPQDAHSVMDYGSGLSVAAGGLFARSTRAKAASAALGASAVGVAAVTDYRLSLKKLIPIEAHEAIDLLWGAAAIAAPFALGYHRRDPITAAVHVATGALTIAASLCTDYRAAAGVGRR